MPNRNNTVVLSDHEKALLVDATYQMFGTKEMAWGATVGRLCTDFLEKEAADALTESE